MIYNILFVLYFVGVAAGLALVFRKAGEAWWKALIPVYNIVVWIKLCGKSWRWYIYFLVPAINIFTFLLMVTETCKVFRRYGFWEQLLAILLPCLYLPWLGLAKARPLTLTVEERTDKNSKSYMMRVRKDMVGAKTVELQSCVYNDPRTSVPLRVSESRDWLDSIVFAIVAAVIIRAFTFELYGIPSSSMEASLMTGDHLMVSKTAYGPRVMMTPLSLPLMHNSIPGTNGTVSSYLDWIKLPYHRYPGFGKVERFDAVVFNFPAGDTLCTGYPTCQRTYYELVRELGREAVWSGKAVDAYGMPVGKVITRPLDKCENYIKRCIGLPGDDLEIADQQVKINGKPINTPQEAQFTYGVLFDGKVNAPRILAELGFSNEDIETARQRQYYENTPYFLLPMSRAKAQQMGNRYDVIDLQRVTYGIDSARTGELFPNDPRYCWSVDNFGPIHIPAKGETVELTLDNLPLYRRVITAYEGNTLRVADGQILINDKPATSYTFKQDYYWMMGDNRHNSQDSRFWGFVPETHIVGKAKTILWSTNKDRGGMRKGRFVKKVE